MSSSETHPQPLQLLTSQLRSNTIKKTESLLLKIVRANLDTQYASKSLLLAEFRDVVSVHSSTPDTKLIDDFRHYIPLSDYGAYKPFMAAFNASPCKEADLKDLFAPGLPYLLALSSATSGKEPKIFPKYNTSIPSILSGEELVALVFFYGYRELKCIEGESGQIVKKIPVSTASSGILRAMLGWTNVDDDDSRMSTIPLGCIAPFAASMIVNHKSFLMIHALFILVCRDTHRIVFTFSTLCYDLVQYVDEQWDMFISSIKNGTIPDLPGVQEVLPHLQVHFRANSDRAAELSEIGPPNSCEGWAARVWPKLGEVTFGCSGPFATVLPKLRTVIGQTIAITSLGCASSESHLGSPYRSEDPHTFVLRSSDVIEFLDVTAEESHKSILQAWELEVGKQYEVILTTADGLWRYRLGDIIDVVGFDPNDGFPVFVLSGRRSLGIRLTSALISDSDIISAIRAICPDVIQVNEFTAVLDDRHAIMTVGCLIEPASALGSPNARLASQRLSEGLAAANTKFQSALQDGRARDPSVRILKPGTFAAFRQWKAKSMNIGPGQVKVPAVLVDDASRKWVLERVVGEL